VGGRSFASGNFSLELDGANVGVLRSISGGDAVADVIVENAGTSFYPHKHIGNPRYEDFAIQCGFGMDKTFFDWIAAAWKGTNERKDGAIVAADFNGNVKSKREFSDALLSETTIPALDGASKDAAFFTVKFSPETVHTVPGSGKQTVSAPKQKQWLASNFRLEIDGLDTTRVAKIEAFTIKQGVTTNPIGETRDFTKVPGKLEFPNLKITLSQVGSESWFQWFDDFVIQGNNAQDDERSGTLRFLAANLKDELGEVRFFNLGIFKLGAATMEAGAVSRVVAELYCERMEFGPPSAPTT
jgi:phage tail-like protein